MQNFKRKITYFYQHHNGNVGSTSGFMKLEIRGDKVKIIINIQEPMGIPFDGASLYFYHEAGDHLSAIKVDKVESIDGVLTYQNRTDWQNVFRTDRDLYTFDGVAVVYNDVHYYIGDFKDKDRKNYQLVKKELKPVIAQMDFQPVEPKETSVLQTKMAPQKLMQDDFENIEKEVEKLTADKKMDNSVPENNQKSSDGEDKAMAPGGEPITLCKDCPYQKKRMEQHENVDAFEEMIEKYPKLPMYGVTELFDCVRIHPRDIGKLDMRNWKLGVNSFLTHGFYTYQYLLLGRLRFEDGTSQEIIGVPGVYSNRERYLANMFGFEQFIPIKQTGIKTGEFGYWIVEVMPSL